MKKSQFIDLVVTKVKFNLRAEAAKSYLSYIWWGLEPLLFIATFYFVFGVLMQRGGPEFLAFLFCGNIPYLWFSKTVSNASQSIQMGKGLIQQVRIHKVFFPIVIIFQDLVKQSFIFVVLFLSLILLGVEPQTNWFFVILIILTQLLLISAVSFIAAAIIPFLPDFRFLVVTGLQLLLFASGIFYDYKERLLPVHQELFLLNPIANLIVNYRKVLLENAQPDFNALAVISFCSAFVILLVVMMLNKLNGTYSKLVTQ